MHFCSSLVNKIRSVVKFYLGLRDLTDACMRPSNSHHATDRRIEHFVHSENYKLYWICRTTSIPKQHHLCASRMYMPNELVYVDESVKVVCLFNP